MLAATQGLTEAVTSALGAVTDEGREASPAMPPPPPPAVGSPLPPPLPPSPLPPTPPLPSSLPPPRGSIDLPSPPLSISQVEWTHSVCKQANTHIPYFRKTKPHLDLLRLQQSLRKRMKDLEPLRGESRLSTRNIQSKNTQTSTQKVSKSSMKISKEKYPKKRQSARNTLDPA